MMNYVVMMWEGDSWEGYQTSVELMKIKTMEEQIYPIVYFTVPDYT
jgi:hypothetical protein